MRRFLFIILAAVAMLSLASCHFIGIGAEAAREATEEFSEAHEIIFAFLDEYDDGTVANTLDAESEHFDEHTAAWLFGWNILPLSTQRTRLPTHGTESNELQIGEIWLLRLRCMRPTTTPNLILPTTVFGLVANSGRHPRVGRG